ATDIANDLFDLEGFCLKRIEIFAKELDTDLRPNAGADHEDTVLDRLEEAGDIAGDIRNFGAEFGDELFPGQAVAPFRFGLEHDGGFDHLDGGGVGGGIGAAELAGDGKDLRGGFDHAVLPGHDALHFGEG